MKMSPATRMMLMSDRYKKSGEKEVDRHAYRETGRYGAEHTGEENKAPYYDHSRGKPQHMYAAGVAWTGDERENEYTWKHKEVDEECAMRWVHGMKAADGSQLPHFKPESAEQMRVAHCPECSRWEWFVAINMMYADYIDVAKKLGVNRDEFYALMAKAFLLDEDAGPHKLATYMEEIPKK